jgi:hypothetical protein
MRFRNLVFVVAACAGLLAACQKAEEPRTLGGYVLPSDEELISWINGWVIEDLALQATTREDRLIDTRQMLDFKSMDTTYDEREQLFSTKVSFELKKERRYYRVDGAIRYRPAGTGSELDFVNFLSRGITELASW